MVVAAAAVVEIDKTTTEACPDVAAAVVVGLWPVTCLV